jgi:gamma-glutamylcyclotransferase (GGCT)/AIG2-like uncharacterized protein YtfP
MPPFTGLSFPLSSRKTMQNLFAYGSLMCEDIMFAVAGEPLRSSRALLPGYGRFFVENEQYPGVIPYPGDSVDGVVYHEISPAGWERLDHFEGEMYDRRLVSVLGENGDEAHVYCYVIKPEYQQRLTTEKWDFEKFLHGGKEIFLTRYQGFKDIV